VRACARKGDTSISLEFFVPMIYCIFSPVEITKPNSFLNYAKCDYIEWARISFRR